MLLMTEREALVVILDVSGPWGAKPFGPRSSGRSHI